MFIIIIEEPSPECGHHISEFDTPKEAQEHMKEGKKSFTNGDYWNSAEVMLCEVLDIEEWECKGK